MANYATNIFYASTENEKDLDKVENFLEDTFCDCTLTGRKTVSRASFRQNGTIPKKR